MRAKTPELDLVQNGWKREVTKGALTWRHPHLIGACFTFGGGARCGRATHPRVRR
jgi:hypothetical protein